MRTFLIAALIVAAVFAVAIVVRASTSPVDRAESRPSSFTGYVYDADGVLVGPVAVPTERRPEAEWKRTLTGAQYRIVREAGTERAFTGALLKNTDDGVYTCVACGLPLFESKTKFDSGTGWPSFHDEIGPGNVIEHPDRAYGMVRTEINCARCDGHLGHVFDDGPPPTGLRYCVNSASIGFTKMEGIKTLADPAAKRSTMSKTDGTRATAVFAGGCFWCVEAVFEELEGVHEAISGYAGGDRETANYKAVCSGNTKHAEAVQIVYDPSKIAYEDLLRVHFATHDPTQLNRQGNDYGPQYRSALFFANAEEKAIAEAFIDDLGGQGLFRKKIVTTLEPLTEFFPAEAYHQNYVCENPNAGYVRGVALPKVEKVRKQFKDKLKETSPLEAR